MSTTTPIRFRTLRRPGLAVVVMLVAVAGSVAGCGADGQVYAIGDCLKTSVDASGAAEKTDCGDSKSFTVTMLAAKGGRPTCPYYVNKDFTASGAAYVTDAVTDITYCGSYNGPH